MTWNLSWPNKHSSDKAKDESPTNIFKVIFRNKGIELDQMAKIFRNASTFSTIAKIISKYDTATAV